MGSDNYIEMVLNILYGIFCVVTPLFIARLNRNFDRINDKLENIVKALESKVSREDCKMDMNGHCSRLNEIEKRVTENAVEIRFLRDMNRPQYD